MRKFKLVRVGSACPEAYDVYEGDVQVAYLRLRHGTFNARCPDYSGTEVYCSSPRGDGIFDDEQERSTELQRAVNSISRHLDKEPEPKLAEYTVEQE